MDSTKKTISLWQSKRFLFAMVAFLALSGAALASKTSLFASLMGGGIGSARQLTIIARADGTFDIKEFAKQNQWFGPEVVGEALRITAAHRFGQDVKAGSVSILVQADPGVGDETIRVALVSIGQQGFHRIGFTDPHLGDIARQVIVTPLPDTSPRADNPASRSRR